MPQVGGGLPAGVADGGQGPVEALGVAGQVPRGLGLHDHGRHVVGDDVVELAGDAGALGGAGGLGDVAAAVGLGGAGGPQPGADGPGGGGQEVEQDEPVHALLGPEADERDRGSGVDAGQDGHGGPAVVAEVGARADERERERGPGDRVVGAEGRDQEAQRDQGEAGGGPLAAHGQREALEGDHHDRHGAEGARGQVADLRLVAAEHRQERGDGEEQPEGEVPDRDVEPPPPLREPPKVHHRGSLATASARAARRRGTR